MTSTDALILALLFRIAARLELDAARKMNGHYAFAIKYAFSLIFGVLSIVAAFYSISSADKGVTMVAKTETKIKQAVK